MIPVRLIIEGIYSYRDRQTIDFSDLTNAGLFGIFGTTGSGKSSVLEAITYVLYGETERLNAREKRTYNMLNLKSNRAYIELDYYNHEEKLFRATLELRRNTKKFEEVYSPARVFYEFKNNDWEPLDHTDAEKTLGLSYLNFKRTIIIPQGQFREFLELGSKDRTQMMKEIFKLHRFDLQDKVTSLRKENTSLVDQAEGELKGYECVSDEELQQKSEAFKAAEQNHQSVKKEFDLVNETYQQLRHLKKDADNLQMKKTEFAALEIRKQQVHEAEKRLEEYERISALFSQLLTELDKNETQLRGNTVEKEKTEKELKEQENSLRQKESELLHITPYYESLPDKKLEEIDLDCIIHAMGLTDEIKVLKERSLKGLEMVRKTELKEKNIDADIEEKENRIPELTARKLDSSLIINIESWYIQHQNILQARKNQSVKVATEKKKLTGLTEELKSKNINPETFEEDHKKLLMANKSERDRLEKLKSGLDIHRRLSEYRSALHEGDPCPLCGSTEHPEMAKSEDVEEEWSKVTRQIQETENKHEQLLGRGSEAGKLLERKRVWQQNFENEEAHSKELMTQAELHRSRFLWPDFDPDNPDIFRKKKEETESIERMIGELNSELSTLRKQKESIRKEMSKYQSALEDIHHQMASKQGRQDSLIQNMKKLKYEDFREKMTEEVRSDLKKLRRKNKESEDQFQFLTKEINQIQTRLAARRSAMEFLIKRNEEINREHTTLQSRLQQHLDDQEITDMEMVRHIISQKIDPATERNRIRQFEVKYETLRVAIFETEERLNQAHYSDEKFLSTEEHWLSAGNKMKEANDTAVKLKAETDRLEKQLAKKKKLVEEYEKMKRRGENLQTLYNLFKGSGFVEYISSIYLQQLCDHANVRFHRMTRNRLSLQINENNDFEIIDYLNEGRSRSVKTLSGGQSFQVSLSLALALAESVQSNIRAPKNFFFIDEGFGTQDADSINVIFETLINLNRENKIVGIISHVEDLKDRIPRAINVLNDPEKGSLIFRIE